jgi:hypothetical protein
MPLPMKFNVKEYVLDAVYEHLATLNKTDALDPMGIREAVYLHLNKILPSNEFLVNVKSEFGAINGTVYIKFADGKFKASEFVLYPKH